MLRIAICCFVIVVSGCMAESESITNGQQSDIELEDGGVVEDADRERAEAFLVSLGKVRNASEEKELLGEFGHWLNAKGYQVRVEMKNGKHILACPCFPPVTPWASHAFFDETNLEALPLLDDG